MWGMGANGSSVYDHITNGWKRVVSEIGDSRGVTLPAEFADDNDIQLGDNVAIREGDGDETVLELHFGGDGE